MRAGGCAERGPEAGQQHRRTPRRGVAGRREHGRARDVLGRHRHHVERERDADDRADLERGRGEPHAGHVGPREQVGSDREDDGDEKRDRERGGRRPARRVTLHDEPHDDDRQHVQRCVDGGQHGREAQGQQDAGEHRVREPHGDRGDEAAERAPQPGRGDEQAGHQERTDCGAPRDEGRGHKQRGAGRGPRERDRCAVPAAQPDGPDPLQHAQCDEPRGGLRRVGAHGARAGEHTTANEFVKPTSAVTTPTGTAEERGSDMAEL